MSGSPIDPKFKHDCTCCKFLGHYFGHDVYRCGSSATLFSGSIVARYGNEGFEYASQPVECFMEHLDNPVSRIRGSDRDGKDWTMPYQEYVFSDKCCPSTKAMVLALAIGKLTDE